MEYAFDFNLIVKHAIPLLKGLLVTLNLALAIIALALSVGLVLCVMKMSRLKVTSYFATAWIELFRNVPRIVLLLWVYYSSAMYFNIQFSPWIAAFLALGIQEGAFMAEIYRAGIESVDKGELEAGRSLGLSYIQMLRKIILPQAIKTAIPAFTNQLVMAVKTTTIASVIGVPGLLYWTTNISRITFHPIEFYTSAALIFFLICWGLAEVANFLERKLASFHR
jgi:polar amino acid transport system permease protein